jgi:hypothetical protein
MPESNFSSSNLLFSFPPKSGLLGLTFGSPQNRQFLSQNHDCLHRILLSCTHRFAHVKSCRSEFPPCLDHCVNIQAYTLKRGEQDKVDPSSSDFRASSPIYERFRGFWSSSVARSPALFTHRRRSPRLDYPLVLRTCHRWPNLPSNS